MAKETAAAESLRPDETAAPADGTSPLRAVPRPGETAQRVHSAAEAQAPREPGGTRLQRLLGPIAVPPTLLRIALGVLVLGVMTAGTFFLVTDVIAPALGPAAPTAAGANAAGSVAGALDAPGEQLVIDEMIVNPAGTLGRRFLRLGVTLETVDGPKALQELNSRSAQVRDLLIREFSSRTLEELTDPEVREEIRAACLAQVNAHMISGKVSRLYFTDYVLQ